MPMAARALPGAVLTHLPLALTRVVGERAPYPGAPTLASTVAATASVIVVALIVIPPVLASHLAPLWHTPVPRDDRVVDGAAEPGKLVDF